MRTDQALWRPQEHDRGGIRDVVPTEPDTIKPDSPLRFVGIITEADFVTAEADAWRFFLSPGGDAVRQRSGFAAWRRTAEPREEASRRRAKDPAHVREPLDLRLARLANVEAAAIDRVSARKVDRDRRDEQNEDEAGQQRGRAPPHSQERDSREPFQPGQPEIISDQGKREVVMEADRWIAMKSMVSETR